MCSWSCDQNAQLPVSAAIHQPGFEAKHRGQPSRLIGSEEQLRHNVFKVDFTKDGVAPRRTKQAEPPHFHGSSAEHSRPESTQRRRSDQITMDSARSRFRAG